MPLDVSRLDSEISELTSAVDSAEALLTALATEIRANANNPAEINRIADALDAQGTRLANAVVANTPAAPTA
jgi:hypothetical protein